VARAIIGSEISECVLAIFLDARHRVTAFAEMSCDPNCFEKVGLDRNRSRRCRGWSRDRRPGGRFVVENESKAEPTCGDAGPRAARKRASWPWKGPPVRLIAWLSMSSAYETGAEPIAAGDLSWALERSRALLEGHDSDHHHRPEDTCFLTGRPPSQRTATTTTAAAAVPLGGPRLLDVDRLPADGLRPREEVTAVTPLAEAALGDELSLRLAQLVDAGRLEE